jgi:hypothetical protein
MRAFPRGLIAVVLSLGAIAACDRTTSPSSAGPVSATLVSQFTDDAAALIEFRGDVQSVSAPAGTTIYSEPKPGGVTQVLIVREVPGIIEFTLHLANRSKKPEARILDVSDAFDVPRTAAGVSAYRVEY